MVGRLLQPLILLALLALSVVAQSPPKCGGGRLCPADTPCCSQYGDCGVGAYCLGGCDPVNSASLDSCVPSPVCQDKTFDFNNLNGIESNTKFLGDPSKADWVSSGTPLSHDGSVLLTMAEGTVGTLLASTRHMWYGKASAKLTTAAGAGVVTAFILLGDSKDEIDFEFVGTELTSAQTNFYSLGVTNYDNGGNTTGLSNVYENQHTYEIDWTPDKITWSIDGRSVRTVNREDTWNATANRYSYPQTPSRVQLSVWPGGLPTNGEGTIEWAGGLVQWDSPYMTNGYYYAAFDQVTIECYDPPTGAKRTGNNAYIYTDKVLTNASVEITNDNTILQSLLGTGTNMSADYPDSASASASDLATVPGLSGAGPGTNGQRGDNGTDTGSSGSNDGSDGSGTSTGSGSASTGFVQGSSGTVHITGNPEVVLKGSVFAVVVALVALCVL